MNQLDAYYKALLEYKKIADSNTGCETFLRALSDAPSALESIELVKTVCTVDEEWVLEIEKGLVHIANAIDENRQFILSKGEVLPIEKVKGISVESVKHLAKHSNLISRAPTNGEVIPDSLYAVERLNDYTVYENRFLYMLLCYLRDFISIRQEKIVEFSHKYEGALTLKKALHLGGREVSYHIDLKEGRKNDVYLRDHSPNKEIINRISVIFQTVLSRLSTPLMEYAAKVSILKPPITKTNVLKMDKHFKGAVELYDYIMAYAKPGYETTEIKQTVSKFDNDLSNDIAHICSLLSFVTYKNALGIGSELACRNSENEERQKRESIKHYRNEIAQIKNKLIDGEIEPEEYILALENRFDVLEDAYIGTEAIREKLFLAEEELSAIRAQNSALELQSKKLDEALENESNRRFEEIRLLKMKYDQKLSDVEMAYSQKVNDAQKEYSELLSSEQSAFNKELAHANHRLELVLQESATLKKAYAKLLEKNLVANAKLETLLAENGEIPKAYTEKEKFDLLEAEYKAFTRLYKRQWKLAKREIQRKLLNIEALKGQKDNDDE